MFQVAGLGDQRSPHALGAYAVYSCAESPVQIWVNGRCVQEGNLVLVPPFVTHHAHCENQVAELLLEAETISPEGISANWASLSQLQIRRYVQRFREILNHGINHPDTLRRQSFDSLFFDRAVPERRLDIRIATVVDTIRFRRDGPSYPVCELAKDVGLSRSRLTHFFSEQLGVNIRLFRAWKRARGVIPLSLNEQTLLGLAIEAGYADSSHFSHAIRSFFGLKAADLCRRARNFSAHVEMDELVPKSDRAQGSGRS
jgi:AraC-like DNA-binding protein